ncbi:MAG: Mur ligase family protein, partial [Tumebacillaceae bacterium]
MKKIRSQAFLDLFADKKVKGSLPSKIRDVVDEPGNLGRERAVLFDRLKSVDAKSLGKYGPCVIVTEDARIYEKAKGDVTVILVPDVEEAFWKFVSFYRQLFQIPVFAVTGTCGKTTTKEMITHILSKRHHVQATIRSKNSGRFHLPYLLGIDEETDAAVFEMGVAKPGDVLESSQYFRPTVGVVTNIGVDHLNEFASYGDYVKAKEEMLAGLGHEGTLVLNADDSNIATFDLTTYRGSILTFGLGEGADFVAKEIGAGWGGMEFTLVYQHLAHTLFVPGYGKHNVYNALAAIAAVYAVGIGIEEAGAALRSYQHLQGHMNVLSGMRGSLVIDDTWNSNPTSVETAIQVLCDLAKGRKKIVVLGR